ncbi:ROK family protein [Mesobacillus maritimus]|uniref:ROK family protein n=1 Tax=Mesobacillus maritimus TaxID=1643336 RepID=A0ABS7KAN5_9BACI|nr:ROK family protein [Mesobacillus maritimus]MBY0099180.1 ROK family protein [Mesobacillus maritimus]
MNYYAVLDVGGSSIKFALMSEAGEFIERSMVPTPREGIQVFIDTIETIVKNFQNMHPLKGIALSMPGAVDVESGVIYGASAIPYIHGPNIKQLLQERTGLPVELENDANCAGLAEGWIGAAKHVQDYICIVIGTGVGGALVLDKKVRHGKNLHGGEFGFMIMEDYLEQPFGVSLSSLGATGGLVKLVAKRKGMDPSLLNGKIIFEMADSGDEDVQDEIRKFIKRLAVGILNLQYSIDPEKILIGGAISQRQDLIDGINEALAQMKNNVYNLTIKVERCQFGNDSNLIGALYHFLQRKTKLN